MEKTGQKAADHYVEVCSNEDGFLGSYFLARVIGSVAGGEKLRVEYATLLDDSGKAPLKEVVRASHVRPLPPQVRVSRFDVLDEVDAYDLDGWWAGRVTARKDDFNYVVYFDSSGDEFDYPASALRVHLEFDNGRWVSSVKDSTKTNNAEDNYCTSPESEGYSRFGSSQSPAIRNQIRTVPQSRSG